MIYTLNILEEMFFWNSVCFNRIKKRFNTKKKPYKYCFSSIFLSYIFRINCISETFCNIDIIDVINVLVNFFMF